MRYEIKLEGLDHGTGGTYTATEFRCEDSFLERMVSNFGGEGVTLSELVREVGEEISAHLHFEFENAVCADESEDSEYSFEDCLDERGYFVCDGEGDWEARVYHGWGMSDTVALTAGGPIARALEHELGTAYLVETYLGHLKNVPLPAVA